MLSRLRRLLRLASRDMVVLWHAFRHAGTPRKVKVLALLLALYVISPIDLISDLVPVLGWVDDITLLALAVPALLKLVPDAALRDAQAATDRSLAHWPFWRRS